MEQINGMQNERIRALEVEVCNLKERFEKFLTNDFKHLEAKVWWILGTLILGFITTIFLNLFLNL